VPTGGRSAGVRPADRRWTALVVIAVAQADDRARRHDRQHRVPSAQRSLGFGDADRQWVITAYTLTFAGLLLLGGRIADGFGRQRSSLPVWWVRRASALAGAAPGCGADRRPVRCRAVRPRCSPEALSLIAVTFRDAKERGTAFAVYGAWPAAGRWSGLILGGVLTEYLQWRCVSTSTSPSPPPRSWRTRGAARPAGPVRRPAAGRPTRTLITAGIAAVVLGCAQRRRTAGARPR